MLRTAARQPPCGRVQVLPSQIPWTKSTVRAPLWIMLCLWWLILWRSLPVSVGRGPFSKSLGVLCRVKNAWLWALIFSITVLTTRHYPTMVAFRGALTFKNGKWDGLILVCPWSWAASASARSTLDESHPFTVFWFLFFFSCF